MENIDGALAFKATLNIDDFNVSAQSMERRIRDFSDDAIEDVGEVEDAFHSFAEKAGQYISYYLVGQGMMGLLQSIIQVRGQFQQLEIAFETMLGSSSKAKQLMGQMVETAAKTPFDLMGVAEGAKQLMAYGVSADKVNDTLVRLGNIASGLSIPLNDIVYLYGTTMVQGRLYAQDVRQFTGRGIPLVKELAEKYGVTADKINEMVSAGKIGFPEVEEVINKMTNAGGQFFNLMEKQSASLTGQIANLEDAWDSALNKIGEQNEDLFATGISGATYLVEHMDDILRIIKSITVAYGSYKAAVVLQTLATKGYTGVALIDNTVRSAKMALMKAGAVITGQVTAQTKAMTAAEQAHVAALQQQLTAEENANLVKQLRITTIQQLLTAQQQEYLSNLNITASNAQYEAVAMQILTVEQREALSKLDLSSKSAIYRAALEQEVGAKVANQNATVASMRIAVKEAAAKLQQAKTTAVASTQAVEAARYEVYWAKQSGDATRIATAEKRLAGAVDNQTLSRKAALAAQTDFYTKKKQLETAATIQGKTAAIAEDAATKAQVVTKGLLATATTKATAAVRALWAACMANPITAILSLVGMLISAFMLLDDTTDDTTNAMDAFGESGEKQAGHLSALFGVLEGGEKGTRTYKKALEEVNQQLKEHGLALIGEQSSLQDIEDAHKRIEAAIKKENAERQRANSLNRVSEKYAETLDKIGASIQKELKEAHHYDATWALSFDSDDIQNKADALTDQIRGVIEDELPNIANLDPAKKEQAKAKLRKQITDIMVAAGIDKSHAQFITDYSWLDDMYYDVFSERGGIIDQAIDARRAFEDQTVAANNAYTAIKNQSDAITGLGDASEDVVPKVDLSKFSLEELHDMANKLNGKEVGLDIKVYGYSEAKSMLNDIMDQIGVKQNNLNTESGLSSEISNLKKLRGEAELGSQTWKDYNAQIDTLQKKLDSATGRGGRGGKNTAEEAARNAQALSDKQLQAAKRLEEARISVMEDGYKKRKAQLDLQHQDTLNQINKEERELIEARKKAGRGGLSDSEKMGFTTRRQLATQSYEQEDLSLTIAEIAEKRKQYELYWRWVANMGKGIADKQFAELLKSGSSYKAYLDSEIEKLESKLAAGDITDGEQKQLFTFKTQRDEINGAKSAMDLFKESLSQSLSQATTLAEKIEAIADAKERLADGSSGLISEDDIAAADKMLSDEERKNQQEIQQTLLKDYRTYEEQRKSIQEQYALLRYEAEKTGNAERVKMVNDGEAEALSSLNANMLKTSDAWKKLFLDLDNLSTNELATLIGDIESQLANSNLKLNPVDYKALTDSLEKAKEELINKNPFKALNTFYNDYIKAKEKLALAKAKLAAGTGSEDDVKKAEADVRKASRGITNTIKSVTDAATSCASSLQGMFDALGMSGVADGIGTAIALVGELGNAAASVGKFMSGDIVGGITGMVGAVTSVVGIFAKLHDAKYEKRIQRLQDEIDGLERAYSRLERAYNNTYWVFNDEQREAYEKNINLINNQIEALEKQREVARKSWNFVEYAKLTKEIQDLQDALSKAKEGGDMWDLYNQQIANLRKQQEDIRGQIKAENDKKKTDKGKIQQYYDSIEDIEQQIEDLQRSMRETLAGTDTKTALDEFADALVDAYCKGEDAAEALGAKTKDVLKKAVVEALKRQFLAKAIDDAIQFLGEAMEDGVLSATEKSKFEYMVNAAGETFNTALEGIGDWIKDISDADSVDDPLEGAIKGMSDETAGVIAGRANAIVINQSEMIVIGRSALAYQAQIAANTKATVSKLEEIHTTIKKLDNNNSLLSQGIS
nr:MAG TPA: Tape measure domain protein [Caudoviricetes sp.]